MSISLSSISRTTRNSLPPRVVIHGAQKVGKSTFAAGAYAPIFLPLEDGLSGIEVDAFNGGAPLKTFEEVQQAVATLRNEEHAFGTAVIDSTDWLEPMIWDYACRKNNWASIESPGYGKGYIEANHIWREFLADLNALRMNRGMAVILIAHSAVKRFEAPDSEAYDRYELKMQKGALGLIVEWADAILYAADETAIKKEKTAGDNIRTRAIGTGRRVMHCNAKPSFIAGNRYRLPDTLDLSWSALMAAMQQPAQAA